VGYEAQAKIIREKTARLPRFVAGAPMGVCTENLNPDVMVMESAEQGV
jgi:hypothetical protein